MILKGWVKNLPEGSVQIKAEGTNQSLAKLIEWCKQGPQFSNVTDVLVEEVAEEGFQDFEIVY